MLLNRIMCNTKPTIMNLLKRIYFKTILANIIPNCVLRKDYYFSLRGSRPAPAVVFSYDARYAEVGFADVLRGIISSYAFAKAKKMSYYIDFTIPFKLSDYLVPKEYDWRIKANIISNNLLYSTTICSMNHDKGKVFKLSFPRNRQYHIYSNVNFLNVLNKKYKTSFSYGDLFHELFKPSPYLQEHINGVVDRINDKYVSVSFRFTTLLGDFHDCINRELPIEDQIVYINKCHSLLEELHKKHFDMKFFVTSDSQKFIDSLIGIDWIFTIQGKRGQFNNESTDASTLNTFLDFMIISQAQKVFMAHTGKMYRSNFSRSAAMAGGIPFEEIEF